MSLSLDVAKNINDRQYFSLFPYSYERRNIAPSTLPVNSFFKFLEAVSWGNFFRQKRCSNEGIERNHTKKQQVIFHIIQYVVFCIDYVVKMYRLSEKKEKNRKKKK